MAAKLILLLAFGFLVADAYRAITFTMKRDDAIPDEHLGKKPYSPVNLYSKPNLTRSHEEDIKKKNILRTMDQNELRSLDFWRTLSNCLKEQPVIMVPEQDMKNQLEYIQNLNSEY